MKNQDNKIKSSSNRKNPQAKRKMIGLTKNMMQPRSKKTTCISTKSKNKKTTWSILITRKKSKPGRKRKRLPKKRNCLIAQKMMKGRNLPINRQPQSRKKAKRETISKIGNQLSQEIMLLYLMKPMTRT